ncbi:hypothetical protein [Legionella donaldsonii]|uniref:hypothetical protein n=1 Tax=Legionella donaldsonii TaxID=45060 RepID=UPI000E1BB228|nr:hypothetical protein [Legionella donaldsonii]
MLDASPILPSAVALWEADKQNYLQRLLVVTGHHFFLVFVAWVRSADRNPGFTSLHPGYDRDVVQDASPIPPSAVALREADKQNHLQRLLIVTGTSFFPCFCSLGEGLQTVTRVSLRCTQATTGM